MDISSGYIDELRDRIGESVSLEVWTEGKTVACYVAESRNPLRVAMAPADILPLHAPAGAKAILSHIPEESLGRLLPESLPSLTANTITSRVELLKRLREYNRQGYSVDNEELHPGIYALGVAVFDSVHKPVAAISAILPSSRISENRETEIVQELKRAARKISKKVCENRPLFSEG